MLEIIAPAGSEHYFAELSPELARDGGPDVEAIGAIQARYGLEMDFASIEPLVRQNGLEPWRPLERIGRDGRMVHRRAHSRVWR